MAVVGGGDTALDEALYLTNICSRVTLAHRGDRLTGSAILQERAFQNPKLEIRYNAVVESIHGDDVVQGVALRDLKTGQAQDMPVAGVFVCVGYHPNTSPFIGAVPMDDGGHIKVDLRMATEVPGVFAAGDCRWHSARQLGSGAGDGITAALLRLRLPERRLTAPLDTCAPWAIIRVAPSSHLQTPFRGGPVTTKALQSAQYDVDSVADAIEFYYEKGWTDGLPVVPPTEEKVLAFLDAAGLEPDAVVGRL